jgi:YHS domain-containing protein
MEQAAFVLLPMGSEPMSSRTFGLLAVLALLTWNSSASRGDDEPALNRRKAQAALKPYGGLVGEWRGVGQPERGKARGAWTESASWAWKLTKDSAALEMKVTRGKYLKAAVLVPGKTANVFNLEATLADGSKRFFAGKSGDRNRLVVTCSEPASSGVQRITLTPLHDTRLLMLLEGRETDGDFVRLGEVGYTRQGVAFAAGESGPVCIVTEGRGTIQVSYKGKTYWVCCSGCRDLFNENPEAVLAEAAQRQKEKDQK